MQEKEKGQEIVKDTELSLKDNSFYVSLKKSNKLITALYMVTDMIEREEPIRQKLRSVGADIISDINNLDSTSFGNMSLKIKNNISSVLSFIQIASVLNMISSMNASILEKEFNDLKNKIDDLRKNPGSLSGRATLSDYFSSPDSLEEEGKLFTKYPIGHQINNPSYKPIARIGVQKGSTLMDAINNKLSKNNSNTLVRNFSSKDEFNIQKLERRNEIISIIKDKNILLGSKEQEGVTITDIKDNAKGVLKTCGEKTLQRELGAMVQDGVLYKLGSKRWSKYFIKSQ